MRGHIFLFNDVLAQVKECKARGGAVGEFFVYVHIAFAFAIMTLNLAEQHRKTLSENLSSTVLAEWQKMASDSLQQQKDIEDADNISFDEYLQQYLAR